jgi:hypothetical protein
MFLLGVSMTKWHKRILEACPGLKQLRATHLRKKHLREIEAWNNGDKIGPAPHSVKRKNILELSQRFNLSILVETGTYYGEMVEAMKSHFDSIYSIELSQELFNICQKKFITDSNVNLSCGDSGIELKNILKNLSSPALFWLDAHYSHGETARGDKDSPIMEELEHILTSPIQGHVIMIDDARDFINDPNYPKVEVLESFVTSRCPERQFYLQDDAILILPQ